MANVKTIPEKAPVRVVVNTRTAKCWAYCPICGRKHYCRVHHGPADTVFYTCRCNDIPGEDILLDPKMIEREIVSEKKIAVLSELVE
jgi:hypothetical protein